MTDFGAFTFLAHTIPGLEHIAWREIQRRLGNASLIGYRRVGQRNGLVLFQYRDPSAQLLQLKSTEDLFHLAAYQKDTSADRRGLQQIESLIRGSKYLDVGLRIDREMHRGRARRHPTFRVIARKEGTHAYRRVDAQRAVQRGILKRYNYKWRLAEDAADLEIWFTLLDNEAFFGLRLSDHSMRHRDYKVQHLPASLRPTLAYAMVFLCDPQPEDVFLDPMCGAGTILIERAEASRHRLLLGGDINPQAIGTTRRNIDPKYKPIQIIQWDATAIPLDDHSIDKVVSNLPFGAQVGTHAENIVLYPAFFQEIKRVLRPGGRMVVLSGEQQLVPQIIQQNEDLNLDETFDIVVLGKPATIYVLDRA
jgi:23S rRNA G2445 N2-methylase RlmL